MPNTSSIPVWRSAAKRARTLRSTSHYLLPFFLLLFALGACTVSEPDAFTVEVSPGGPGANPVPLDGSSVSGEIYISVRSNKSIEEVRFFLDDPDQTGEPLKTDTEAPFDLMLDTTALSDGEHSLLAVTTMGQRGKTKSLLYMSFHVSNTPPPANDPPQVEAGEDMSHPLSVPAELEGSASDDGMPDGILTVVWSKVNGPGTVAFENANEAATEALFSAPGQYMLSLSASDGALTSSDEIVVTVQDDGGTPPPPPPDNEAPTVNAGADQSITLPDSAPLNGSAIDDGKPSGSLTTQWSKISGPGTVTFGNANAPQTTASFSAAGSYTLQLMASDGELSSSDEMVVTVQSAGAPPPPPPPGGDISLPARAAFYYPWYPQTWTVNGAHVFYQPSLGYYSSDDQSVVDQHLQDLDYAKIDVAIASWWGPGTQNEQSRIPLLLNRTQAVAASVRWTFYYEDEGFGDPSVSTLQSDLAYLMDNYTGHASFARIGGKPVIFVYNADDSSCEVADRWAQASNGAWYVVLKVFPGYRNCGNQPDSWHQYSPVVPADQQSGYSYAISPGFWRADEGSARLARDIGRFNQNVSDMVASNEPWQLITTYNEWGEGTAIEGESGWGSAYLDALATDGGGGGAPPPPPPPVSVTVSPSSASLQTGASTSFTASVSNSSAGVTWSATGGSISGSGNSVTYTAPSSTGTYTVTATSVDDPTKSDSASVSVSSAPPPPPSGSVVFGAGGDFGGQESKAGAIMDDMATRNLDAFFILGDISYHEIEPESAWCAWVHGKLGNDYPMQLMTGNHDEDGSGDGWIINHRACMPDRLGSTLGPGGYGVNYASDLGPVTVIATAPSLQVQNVDYNYANGSAERTWLIGEIQAAQAEGDWVVVGMHKNCVTMGSKGCEIGNSFAQLLVAQGVDLILQGHDHTYQRSHSMSSMQAGSVGTIADNGADGVYDRDAGTVLTIAGNVGRTNYTCNHNDSEAGYFQTHSCAEEGELHGYLEITASASELTVEFRRVTGPSYSDSFTIR